MELRRICALYFSATGNTQRVVCALAGTLGRVWRLPVEEIPLITPQERAGERLFRETDFVLLGLPTYAGRLPNKIAPELRGRLRGDGTPAVAVVTYGNRGYDNALAELCALLREGGFYPVGAGAFAGCHAFTDALAPGRPDAADLRDAASFGAGIAEKWERCGAALPPLSVPGDPEAPYYVPLGTDGQPARFLKAKPETDGDRCRRCGLCARSCPMGAIDPAEVFSVPGTCIKCQRCVRGCPAGAKRFTDPAFLSHVAMLEQTCTRRKENVWFL